MTRPAHCLFLSFSALFLLLVCSHCLSLHCPLMTSLSLSRSCFGGDVFILFSLCVGFVFHFLISEP